MAAEEPLSFSYVAQDKSGTKIKGTIKATSEKKAYSLVRSKGYIPTSIKSAEKGLDMEISIPGYKKKAKLKSVAVWSKQFGTLMGAGMPLIRALQVSAEQTQDKALQKSLKNVHSDVDKGQSLSVAMEKEPESFSPLMVSLVGVGEAGGFLVKTLRAIADSLHSEVELRGKVKAALMYPIIVGVIAILAIAVMLIFVVPVFVDMFASMGSELPLPTRILVGLSESMIWAGPLFLLIVGILYFLYNKNKDKQSFKKWADPIKMKVPVFGKLIQKLVIARFAKNLGMMVSAGVPLMNSLDLVGSTANNYPVEAAINHAKSELKKGKTLADPLADHPDVFPSMVTSMISVGEESGSLGDMLDSVSDFYEEEVKLTTESLSAAIEPVMIVGLGVVIGGMVIALYMPMFSIFGEMSDM